MDFALTEEQEMIRDAAREFAQQTLGRRVGVGRQKDPVFRGRIGGKGLCQGPVVRLADGSLAEVARLVDAALESRREGREIGLALVVHRDRPVAYEKEEEEGEEVGAGQKEKAVPAPLEGAEFSPASTEDRDRARRGRVGGIHWKRILGSTST